MHVGKIRMQLDLESHDYFYLKPEVDGSYTLTLTDSSGGPVHLTRISRKQLYGLLNQAQRAVLAADEDAAFSLLKGVS